MKKRIISVILASAMIMALLVPLAPTVFAAGESMSLTVSSVSGTSGETVQVTVRVSNNPGIASLIFDIEYDSALTLTNVEFGSAFRATASAAKPYTNPQPVKVISLMSDVRGNGILATLTFAIDENTENGHEADINITFSPDDIFNSSGAAVGLTVTNGNIEYWYCSACGSCFADSKAEMEISAKDTIILASGHGENLVKVEKVDATVDAAGNVEYWTCNKCGKCYSDADAKNEITKVSTVIPIVPSYTITLYDAKNWLDSETPNIKQIKVPMSSGFNLGQYFPSEVTGYEFVGWSKTAQSKIYNDRDDDLTNNTPQSFKQIIFT